MKQKHAEFLPSMCGSRIKAPPDTAWAGAREAAVASWMMVGLDVNDDGLLTPIDALLVLNYLNSTSAEGEYTGVVSHSAVAAALQETPTVAGVNYGGGAETASSNLEVAVPGLRKLLPIDGVLSEVNGQYDAAPRASVIDSADEALP